MPLRCANTKKERIIVIKTYRVLAKYKMAENPLYNCLESEIEIWGDTEVNDNFDRDSLNRCAKLLNMEKLVAKAEPRQVMKGQ
jgi:hypothetical protein